MSFKNVNLGLQNFLIPLISAFVLIFCLFGYDSLVLNSAKDFYYYAVDFFAALSVCFIGYNAIYMFTQRDEQDEDDVLISSYFYDGYKNGICRVEHFYSEEDNPKVVFTEFSYINEKGEYITNKWFDGAGEFGIEKTAQVVSEGKYYIINSEGKIISDGFDAMTEPVDGIAKVMRDTDNFVNFISLTTGSLLWKEWKKEQ